jgi:hypothetical protein
MARWYCAPDGEQQGPFDESQVREMVRSRRLAADAPVWSEGMAEWMPLRSFPQLLPGAQPVRQAQAARPAQVAQRAQTTQRIQRAQPAASPQPGAPRDSRSGATPATVAQAAAPRTLSYATPAAPALEPAPFAGVEFDPGPFLKMGRQFSVKGSPWLGPAVASPKAIYLLKVTQNVHSHGGGVVGALVSAAMTTHEDTRTCDISQLPPPVRTALDPAGEHQQCDVIILRREAVSMVKVAAINNLVRVWVGGDRFGIPTGLFRNGAIRRSLTDNGWTINAALMPTAAPTHGPAYGGKLAGPTGPGTLARIGYILLTIAIFVAVVVLRVSCQMQRHHGRY